MADIIVKKKKNPLIYFYSGGQQSRDSGKQSVAKCGIPTSFLP